MLNNIKKLPKMILFFFETLKVFFFLEDEAFDFLRLVAMNKIIC